MMSRRAILTALSGVSVFVALLSMPALAQAPQHAANISAARLAEVNRALKSLPPQSGQFTQILPNGGRAMGTYHMDWPARLRFAYDASSGGAIVTVKGNFVAVQETARAEPNWFPVSLTPLAVLRQAVENGIRPDMLVAASESESDGQLALTLHDPSGDLPGTATLYFSGSERQLYAWRLVDVQNLVTQVRLSAQEFPAALSDRVFDIDYDEPDD